MTYSVIAHDPESGAYGVAVQSHWFNVGRSAPWVRFRVGAVATQALTDPSYGWRGLDLMAAGHSAAAALVELLDGDDDADRRQVAFVDAAGEVAVHTGARCVRYADHVQGRGWAVLGNLLATDRVVPAMAEVFAAATGTLAERMVSALEAAEFAGGDLRGLQSAAIRVVPGSGELDEGVEAGIDISVADHPDPVTELRRLVTVDRAYRALRRAETAVVEGNPAVALHQMSLARRLRHGIEVEFWLAIARARMGELDDARAEMERVVATAPRFGEVLARLAEVDPVVAALED